MAQRLQGLADGSPNQWTAKQLKYLAAVVESGGAATVEEATGLAGVGYSSVYRWRQDESFREAELDARRDAILNAVPHALAAVRRLVQADTIYGVAGAAEAGRMARWLLEGTGIAMGQQAAPLRVTATLHVEATAEHPALPASSPLPVDLEADWSSGGIAAPVQAPRSDSSGYLPETP
jgi:hypothetical protein